MDGVKYSMCNYLMANNEKAERYLKSPIKRMILNGDHQAIGDDCFSEYWSIE